MPPNSPPSCLRWLPLAFLLASYVCLGLALVVEPYWEQHMDYMKGLGRSEWLDIVMLCLLLPIPLLFLHALVFSLLAVVRRQARRLNLAVLAALALTLVFLICL